LIDNLIERGLDTKVCRLFIVDGAGDLATYFIGLSVEYEWGPHVSLIVFLFLYFIFLWIAWLLAVRVTKPRTA
jgi:hypothetical protein